MAAVEHVAVVAVQGCSSTSRRSVEATNKMLFPPVIAGEGPKYPRSLFATMKPLLTQPWLPCAARGCRRQDCRARSWTLRRRHHTERWYWRSIMHYLISGKLIDWNVKFFGLDIATLVSQFYFCRLREEEEQTSRTILKTNTTQSNQPSALTTG